MAPQDLESSDTMDVDQQTDIPITSKLPDGEETHMEPEEDDDIDFNPFLRASPAAEASSSLSSEVEGLDHGVSDGGWELAQPFAADSACKQIEFDSDYAVDSSMLYEESMAQKRAALEEQCDKDQEETATRKYKKGKSVVNSEPDMDSTIEKENGSSSGTDVINDVPKEDANIDSCRVPVAFAMDDEDAICKRTRARYSLASFTLDELETFLQETDDDDDLQNVDEEEEYRKFLASVLQGGVEDDQATLDNGNDEDEDNDADFEIEIEEALESDVDDCLVEREKSKGIRRRPETRQNKRQKAFSEGKKKLSEQGKRPLRPLLPILPSSLIPPVPTSLMVETSNMPKSVNGYSLSGFTPHQLGQLYCLIHEHVQLLIQVFSLCVLEPSRRTLATQIQGLLSEMLDKRDQVLTWRNFPHPSFCFGPPYLHPSALDELPKYSSLEEIAGSHEMNDHQRVQLSSSNKSQGSPDLQSCNANGCVVKETPDSFHALHGSSWLPFVGGPVLSVLDVAPLKFVEKYMDDVSVAVQEQVRRYIEATSDEKSEKQPLFPLPTCLPFAEANGVVVKGAAPASSSSVTELSSSCPSQRPAKKTLAATLVESSKKQSVALVPKRIAELAVQFYPLFNPALFPHKPPPLAVANRVLFTDAEDELLAMGLMEYNTDWKAIQQRFLPCKSKHQIFVRQKNRCSSKAPDNPIKDVRRLKTSPLSDEEKARIEEGLTVYKLDWMSIWKLVVPYRDPSLLPRQWRVALGTQKSYRIDPTKREKRRIYESNRRRNKVLAAESLHASDKEDEHAGLQNDSGEECTDNNNEAYVHEAFLADWRPAMSVPASEVSTSNRNSRLQPALMSTRQCSPIVRVPDNHENHEPQKSGYGFQRPYSMDPTCATTTSAMASSTFASYSRPYRANRPRNSQLVRLAPSLPPVNLPPTVRVISQAAFQNSQLAAPNQAASAGASATDATRRQSAVSRPAWILSSAPDLNDATQNMANITADLNDTCPDRENGVESDLQMHPLLFQPPGNGRLPYYPLSSSATAPNSFCFFPTSPYQSHIASLRNSRRPGASVPGLPKSASPMKSSCSLDFHPLLQRTNNANNGSKVASQSNKFSTGLEPSKDPISPPVAANELDLEFNLNSAPRKKKDTAANETEVFLPSNGGNICATDSVTDQSLPEIVMEQEELSDSDDEIDHVEFECEEMADSEGEDEEFYSRPVSNSQIKRPIVAVTGDDNDQHCRPHTDQHCEPPTRENHESPKSRNEVPLLAMDLSGPTEDVVRSPWLSLNSQVCHDANHPQASLSSGASIVSNAVALRLNKLEKSTNPVAAKNITLKEGDIDVQPQVAVSKKLPRKLTSRGLNMDVGGSSCRKNSGG